MVIEQNFCSCGLEKTSMDYSRLRLIYPCVIETVKDWVDCEKLTPIKVGQIFEKIGPTSIGVNCSQSAQSLTISITHGYIKG